MTTHSNRLAAEKSRYLQQHKDNPVHWFPWGKEAFAKARKENKPLFLSIGYSSCHWCHVMAHESFEDEQIAELMNRYFVSIKVDREERPDLDNIYMAAVTAIAGQGGWPLTVFLTPDKKPFYGGTYFPPEPRWGSPGFRQVLVTIHEAWETRREQVETSGESLIQGLQKLAAISTKSDLSRQSLDVGFEQFSQLYDSEYGGFGQMPKFPSSHNLSFLLRYWQRTGKAQALEMVEKTLTEMAKGGIYDHLAGGFHRYSTDERWQIPHFEKMLYDQAMLAKTYLEAFQATHQEEFAQTAREIFDYVLQDMQAETGGFFSAEDADSEEPQEVTSTPKHKKEGAFYVWSQAEIISVLGEKDAEVFDYHYGVEKNGNAIHDPHGEFSGKNILFVAHTLEQSSQHCQKDVKEIEAILKRSRAQLAVHRARRPRSHLDDKILLDWNGLMISSLAFGSRVLNDSKYAQAAQRAARFLLKELKTKEGRLLHRYRQGEAAIDATLADYAFFIQGLMDLYEATFDAHYLKEANELARDMIRLFWDEPRGGFFMTANDAEELILRQKDSYDGAYPSGNSVAALDLLRLASLTFHEEYHWTAQELMESFAQELNSRPSAHGQMLIALDYWTGPVKEIVLATDGKNETLASMLKIIDRSFIPNKVVIVRDSSGPDFSVLLGLAPFIEGQPPLAGQTTAYVCENHVCKLPTQDVRTLEELLREKPVTQMPSPQN